MPLISIIVPVYRPGKYLKTCLDSLVGQTFKSYEIICVDNASTDGSALLLKEYTEKFPSIISVYTITENKGEWPARKLGISKARGEYIGFCDSDDSVHPDMYQQLYDAIQKADADVSICAFQRVSSETGQVFSTDMAGFGNKVMNVKEDYGSLALITPTWWCKLYRKTVIEKTLCYDKFPALAPDLAFYITLLPFVNKIAYINKPLYYYMVHPSSVSNNASTSLLEEVKLDITEIKKSILSREQNIHLLPLLDLIAFVHFGVALLLSISKIKNVDIKEETKNMITFLDKHFSTWRNSEYLTFKYIIKHNKSLFKARLACFFLKHGLMPQFLAFYKTVTALFKTDIKW